ncbi:TlpA disulfide reductase family protein [Proteiniphilum sp. X52]|uniref:TlpA family protein disulfide reductase n=1 Tax=Proteiniphilum sp. X52 TaxID=2382159 RepID=UPI000F09BE0D|nr:TlpA family protein disulfide reductase [Proteiniphilum sp. X52]
MTDINGNETLLSQNRGKILVLDCWHDGCGPCFKQLPRFQELFDNYKGIPNLQFYTLGVTFNDSVNLFDVLNKRNINLPSFVIRGKDAEKLGIKAYPTIIIVDDHSRKIFMGNLSNCESFLKKRFNKNKPSNGASTLFDTKVQDTIRMLSLRPDSLRSEKNNLSGNPHSPFNLFTL